jgi:hypothetical protein
LTLERTDPDLVAARQHHEFIVDPQHAAGECAGHDGSGTFGCEHPVDPESRLFEIGRGRRDLEQPVERFSQRGDTHTVDRINRHDLGVGEERALGAFCDFHLGEFDEIVIGLADLREGDHAVRDPEQAQDAEVLLGLGLPAFRGGNDE